MRFSEILCDDGRIFDKEFATRIYGHLCNLVWFDYIDEELIEFSWRGAGGFISNLRSRNLQIKEDYLDFYCSNNEGVVEKEIEDFFNKNYIILLDGFYDYTKYYKSEDEILNYYKSTNPVLISYYRDKKIDSIL